MCAGPQRHPSAVVAITFEAICGLDSGADHAAFPAKLNLYKYSPWLRQSVLVEC